MLEILDSVGKVRILYLLAVEGETNITAISRITNLNHARTVLLLNQLLKLKLVQEKIFGRIKIFSINPKSEAGKRFSLFFNTWHRNAKDINLESREKL